MATKFSTKILDANSIGKGTAKIFKKSLNSRENYANELANDWKKHASTTEKEVFVLMQISNLLDDQLNEITGESSHETSIWL